MKQSLQEEFPEYFYIPVILFLSTALLGFGLFLPMISLKELIFWKHTFSVVTGILSLWQEGHFILAAIIFVFSIIFPIVKLGVLFNVWFKPMLDEQRAHFVHALNLTGKWSMLDVFVVANTIVIAKISGFASAQAKEGIYFFCVSILLAMAATVLIERLLGKKNIASVKAGKSKPA